MEIRELPVLFKTLLVERILAGLKTQTRRPVAARPIGAWKIRRPSFGDGWVQANAGDPPAEIPLACPLGRPGDRLWVRETWQALVLNSNYQDWLNRGDTLCDYDEWWEVVETKLLEHQRKENSTFSVVYRAGADEHTLMEIGELGWRPSLHMYRWACRLILEVTDVRAERLQEMSGRHGADLAAEGYPATPRGLEQFVESWDATYAKKGAGWGTNPWVWVADFTVVEKPAPPPKRTKAQDEWVTQQFREAVRRHQQKDA